MHTTRLFVHEAHSFTQRHTVHAHEESVARTRLRLIIERVSESSVGFQYVIRLGGCPGFCRNKLKSEPMFDPLVMLMATVPSTLTDLDLEHNQSDWQNLPAAVLSVSGWNHANAFQQVKHTPVAVKVKMQKWFVSIWLIFHFKKLSKHTQISQFFLEPIILHSVSGPHKQKFTFRMLRKWNFLQ